MVLAALVIATAGLAGTAHFTGARWYPHIGSGTNNSVRTTPLLRLPPGPHKKPRAKAHGSYTSWVLIAVIVVALLVLANLVWRWLRGLRLEAPAPAVRPTTAEAPHVAPPEPEPEPAKLLSGIELALNTLNEEREPADAVIRAWLGLQETAEQSGIVRRASETPTEFASRVLTRAFADPQPVRTLLQLYLRARFGDRPVTADDVSAVRDALEQLLAGWHAADRPGGTAMRSR